MTGRSILFDIAFDLFEPAEAHAWLAAREATSDFAYVITPNVDHVVRLADSGPDLHRSYSQAALCLCDSRVLRRIGRLLGAPLTVVPGSDLVATLFEFGLRRHDRICLIGGRDDHQARLANLYPGLEVLQHVPPMGLAGNPSARTTACRFAYAAQARFILLAVGSPQQELLAAEMARIAGMTGTALCIGASVDFLVGERRRAPRLLRRAGLEWAWRLATEPRRLARRYLVDGPRIFPLAWRWWRAGHARGAANRAR